MNLFKKIGKAATKIGKSVLKIAPAVTSFIPGVGPLVSKALTISTNVHKVGNAVKTLTSAVQPPPPALPVQMDPVYVAQVAPSSIPYETVRQLVVAAYQRGRADSAAGR